MTAWIDALSTAPFWAALGSIIVIDIVLAGDNAIVIALAARNLPPQLQRRAIVWGTVGAIVVRVAMTGAVVALLRIPGLMAVGGLALVWIAVGLLVPQPAPEDAAAHAAATGFWGAMRTIVVADALMGLDNVLAVAGASGGSFLLVVLGLLISIPIVVWCSRLVLRLMDRFPATVYVGAAVLAVTAAHMLAGDPLLQPYLAPWPTRTALYAGVLLLVLGVGHWRARRVARQGATNGG